MPVGRGPPSSELTSPMGVATLAGPMSNAAGTAGSGPSTSSTRVFHALHAPHCPPHLGNAVPHSVQR